MNFAKTLSRDEMKNIMAGTLQGGGNNTCSCYCCDGGGGGQTSGRFEILESSCDGGAGSHSDCQTQCQNAAFNCGTGDYICALCQPSYNG